MPRESKASAKGTAPYLMGLLYRLVFYVVVLFIYIGDCLLYLAQAIFGVIVSFVFSIKVGLHALVGFVGAALRSVKHFVSRLFRGSIEAVGKQTKKAMPKPEQKAYMSTVFMHVKFFLFGAFSALVFILAQQGYTFISDLPNPKLIGNVNFPVSTQIYDRNGVLLYDVFRDQDRTPVKLGDLPDYVVHATLAIEDRNFYNHNGISVVGGVLRAVKDTYKTGDLQGGSTITQQLVKSSLLTPERTFERKIREAILALWTERIFTKNEILQMYLNQVAYGGTAYGIEEAAKTFFNKSARDLTLSEGALLAGLTRAPSSYSPYVNPRLAIQRRNEVLQSMYEIGYLSKEQYDTSLQAPLNIEPPKTFIRAPHFVFYVKSLLEQRYGIRRVEEGGLRVVTTLDVEMQEQIEKILREEVEKVSNLNVSNGAVLVTAPSTGEILAMVGSKNYFEDAYGAYNVTTVPRQPGSSIKPLLYALALEKNLFTAATPITDAPIVYSIPGSQPYRPVNYDGSYHGNVPLRYALANSYNIPAVKVLNEVGVQPFVEHARKMGLTTWNTPERYGLSLSLGSAEVKMIDMAEAYGVFANYGTRVDINPILSVEDFRGDTLETFSVSATPNVLSPQTAFIISDILSDNYARRLAFGPQSDLVIPGRKVAVKTGTTNSKRDNWTDGYTRKFLVSVWVGNNDNSPMNQLLTSGVTGASPIWNRVMTYVLDKNIDVTADVQPPAEFSIPDGVVTKKCFYGQIEYFRAGTEGNACKGAIFGLTPTPRLLPQQDGTSVTPQVIL
jgi:1A family penicillin-binding protein